MCCLLIKDFRIATFFGVACARLLVPFGLFKKKESGAAADRPTVAAPAAGTLSIQQAQDLVHSIDTSWVQELAVQLAALKASAALSLKIINALASEMEREKLKLEGLEQRYRSVAENAKKTVVSSLRREASTELPLPQSANDAKKFKEKFEAMMKRFGEVSGSHSKMLNAFMKKHASKMKNEFEALTKLLNETRVAILEFEQKRMPIVKCSGILNTASQKVSSIGLSETSAQNIEYEIVRIKGELVGLRSELYSLRCSPEFGKAEAIAQEAASAASREDDFHSQLTELFSRVSRAFTKYSYGLTKETEARLQMISEEPWNMLYEKDVSPYSSLLLEIRKSIDTGKVQLKDSDKIIHYLDLILRSLPELQGRAHMLKAERDSLSRIDSSMVSKAKELEVKIAHMEEELTKCTQDFEQQKRQIAEKREELDTLLREAGAILLELTSQKYSIEH
jgi:hypothetical protein